MRLRLSPDNVDRGTLITLWERATEEAGAGGIAAAKVLQPVLGTAARDIQKVHARLVASSTYKSFRGRWGRGDSTVDLVAWLLRPAFSMQCCEDSLAREKSLSDFLVDAARHEEAVLKQVPCPSSCGCGNGLDDSLVEVRATDKVGMGLFAVDDIPKNQWLSKYTGYRRSVKVSGPLLQ